MNFLSSHQTALASAEQTLGANAPRCGRDAWRPKFHLAPRSGWMNDPNAPIFCDGWYHVFYQHNPFGDAWACMHWGHARSRDMVHWQHLPIALAPSHELGEAHCYSGVVAFDGNGVPVILYTSVAPNDAKFEQWAAHGNADLTQWNKSRKNPLPIALPPIALPPIALPPIALPPDQNEFSPGSRDPFLFRADAPFSTRPQEHFYCVIGEDTPDEVLLVLYQALDDSLLSWEKRGVLMRRPKSEVTFLECPNLVQFGKKWLLIVSPYGALQWQSGELDLQNANFANERQGQLEPNDHFYASNTLHAPDGRVVLLGWVRHFPPGRGWNGCLSLPRVLTLDDKGQPCQWPVVELETLRAEVLLEIGAQILSSKPLELPPAPDNGAELSFHCGAPIRLELHLTRRGSVPDERNLRLGWDVPAGNVSLFLDRSVVEIFADAGHWVRTGVLPFAEAELAGASEVRLVLHELSGATPIRDLRWWRLEMSPLEMSPLEMSPLESTAS